MTKDPVLENAERREARLEKKKQPKKREVKGGIHGRLEKAKAEIKAKGQIQSQRVRREILLQHYKVKR